MPIAAPLQAEELAVSISMNELVRERTKQRWAKEPFASVALELDLEAPDSATVRADPNWLRQAFDYVLDNAVEAMAESERKQLTLSTRLETGRVELTIADTGPGIPEQVSRLLFRSRIPKREGEEGLGMGLLMAQTILQAHGGDIEVNATGPSGTTVNIWLPIEQGGR